MSKIICDVCGTSYPESASQCPICGCVRLGDVNAIPNEPAEETGATSSYTYVKGGRFSKNNVRKRNAGAVVPTKETAKKRTESSKNSGNTGLIVVAIVLLLAIVAIVIYIGVHFIQGMNDVPGKQNDSSVQDSQSDDEKDQDDVPEDVPCTGITLNSVSLMFTEAGQTDSVKISLSPKDTTDTVSYSSKDTAIATVDETTGVVTAVAKGETAIVVKCGDQSVECRVFCNFENTDDPVDDPDDDPVDDPVDDPLDDPQPPVADGVYHIDNLTTTYGPYETDITLKVSEQFQPTLQLVDENGNAVKATWIAKNSSVCGISVSQDGLTVTLSHKSVAGTTEVIATYGDKSYSCTFRVTY